MINLKGYFTALYRSFYDGQLYYDMVHKVKGAGLLFLLFLTAVTLISPYIVNYYDSKEEYKNWYFSEGVALINEVPVMSLRDGKVSSPVSQPYIINSKDTGKPIFILDTTVGYTDLHNTEAGILVTETMVYIRKSNQLNEIRSYDLSNLQNDLDLTPEIIKSYADKIIPLIPVIGLAGYFFALLFGFIVMILFAFFISILSFIFTAILKIKIGFDQKMRAAAISIVPVSIIDMFMQTVHMPEIGIFIFLIISMVFMFLILKTSVNEDKYGCKSPHALQ